jgi:hypothetical protein
LASQKYLKDLEQRVQEIRTLPIAPQFTKQAHEEVNYRQSIRLNIIKE